MSEGKLPQPLQRLTARIVGSYLRHHQVAAGELPELILLVHRALGNLGQPAAPAAVGGPAVPARRSVQRDYVVCLDCGFRAKALRRHLSARHGRTAEEYRARWNLPGDYPMAAPAYAQRRSELARELGLGHRKPAASQPQPAPAGKRRGRPRGSAKAQSAAAIAQ